MANEVVAHYLDHRVVKGHSLDGEQLLGLTVRFPPVKPFFFILPADGASNNIRILVTKVP